MPGKWDIDDHSLYARHPEFDALQPGLQKELVAAMQDNVIKQISAQTEAIVRDAIPKALQAQCGLAFKSELVVDPPHPMWSAQSKVITHKVRYVLTDYPPPEWNWLPYESIKELWEKHRG